MSKLIPALSEAQNQLAESIKNHMDERVVRIINESMQASIAAATSSVSFSLNNDIDSNLVVSFLKLFKYTDIQVEDDVTSGAKTFKFEIPLVAT